MNNLLSDSLIFLLGNTRIYGSPGAVKNLLSKKDPETRSQTASSKKDFSLFISPVTGETSFYSVDIQSVLWTHTSRGALRYRGYKSSSSVMFLDAIQLTPTIWLFSTSRICFKAWDAISDPDSNRKRWGGGREKEMDLEY